jgi:hypothetical protein
MLQLYDDKLFDYFKETFKADVAIVPVSDYWTVASMHEEGQLQLPAIVLGRSSWTNAKELESWVIAKRGRTDRIRNNKLVNEQAIPVQLDYTVTLLATTQDDIDELTSEVLFCILNYPRLTIELPYGSDREIHAQIMQNGDLQDSSTRDKFSESGILYQQIIPIRVLGSNIINIREQNLRYIKFGVDVKNANN